MMSSVLGMVCPRGWRGWGGVLSRTLPEANICRLAAPGIYTSLFKPAADQLIQTAGSETQQRYVRSPQGFLDRNSPAQSRGSAQSRGFAAAPIRDGGEDRRDGGEERCGCVIRTDGGLDLGWVYIWVLVWVWIWFWSGSGSFLSPTQGSYIDLTPLLLSFNYQMTK